LLVTTGLAVLAFPYNLPRGAGVGGGARTRKSFWEVVRGDVGESMATRLEEAAAPPPTAARPLRSRRDPRAPAAEAASAPPRPSLPYPALPPWRG